MMTDQQVALKYVAKINSSRARGINFSLTFAQYKRLISTKKCFYTGKLLTKSGDTQFTIDRIDASKGYESGNCVVCCRDINNKKKDLTISEIELIYKKVLRFKNK